MIDDVGQAVEFGPDAIHSHGEDEKAENQHAAAKYTVRSDGTYVIGQYCDNFSKLLHHRRARLPTFISPRSIGQLQKSEPAFGAGVAAEPAPILHGEVYIGHGRGVAVLAEPEAQVHARPRPKR